MTTRKTLKTASPSSQDEKAPSTQADEVVSPPTSVQALLDEIPSLRQARDAANKSNPCSLTASSVEGDDAQCKG